MINNEDLGKLSKLIEKSFVASLIAHGYATLNKDSLKIENLIISPKIIEQLEIGDERPDNSFLQKVIDIYPKDEFTCSKKMLGERLEIFYKKTSLKDVTEDEILEATRLWLRKSDYPYHGRLHNFVSKYDKSKIWGSNLETTILELRNVPETVILSRTRPS